MDDGLESIEQALERLNVELVPLNEDNSQGQPTTPAEAAPSSDDSESTDVDAPSSEPPPLYEDPTEDDSEGEWITPENVSLYKARALGLTPSENSSVKGKKNKEIIPVGCMTADFAMQNTLLQMDLSLVGMEGKKIQKVKTWVLRCHACFKCVRHILGKFLAHSYIAGSVRMRRKSSALRVAIPHFFAHLSPYHPLQPLQMHLLCKYT